MTLLDSETVGPVTTDAMFTAVVTMAVSAVVATPTHHEPAAGLVAVALVRVRTSPAFTVPGTVITTGLAPPPLEVAEVVKPIPVAS